MDHGDVERVVGVRQRAGWYDSNLHEHACLIGAIFRRPVVVGLVYVFFFEALVGSLPGSLKLLSLTFYARCLMYNAAETAGYPVEMLEVSQTVTTTTALAVLSSAAIVLTGLGMWLFSRSEYRDDI